MTSTVGGYSPAWTTPSQALYTDAAFAAEAAVVVFDGNVHILSAGVCNKVTIDPALVPAPSLTEVFTYTEASGVGQAHVFNGDIWFSERQGSGQHKVYKWDGETETLSLEYTTTDGHDPEDGSERLAIGDDGSDIYIAYTAYTAAQNKGLIVRKYAAGTWADQGISTTSDAYVIPAGGMPGHGAHWYFTGRFLGATNIAYALYSSNANVHGTTWESSAVWATTGAVLSPPCLFNGYVYIMGYEGTGDGKLKRVDLSTGDVVSTDHLGATGSRVGPLAVYGSNLYCCYQPASFDEEVLNGAVVVV